MDSPIDPIPSSALQNRSPTGSDTARSQDVSPRPPEDGIADRSVWWTLKAQFMMLAAVIMAVALIQAILSSYAFWNIRDQLSAITDDKMIKTNAAQALTTDLELINAAIVDHLFTLDLSEFGDPCYPGDNLDPTEKLTLVGCNERAIDDPLLDFNTQLFTATGALIPAVSESEDEHTSIKQIIAKSQEFVAHIRRMEHETHKFAQARDRDEQVPGDEHLKVAYQAYVHANRIAVTDIGLPPAHDSCSERNRKLNQQPLSTDTITDNIACLNDTNRTALKQSYTDVMGEIEWSLRVTFICSMLLCVLLLTTIGRLATITHRLIDVGLILALLTHLSYSVLITVDLWTLYCPANSPYGTGLGLSQNDAWTQHCLNSTLYRANSIAYDNAYGAASFKRYGTIAHASQLTWLLAKRLNEPTIDWQRTSDEAVIQANNRLNHLNGKQQNDGMAEQIAMVQKAWDDYSHHNQQVRDLVESNQPDSFRAAQELSIGASHQAFGAYLQQVDMLKQRNNILSADLFNHVQRRLARYRNLSAMVHTLTGLIVAVSIFRRLQDF